MELNYWHVQQADKSVGFHIGFFSFFCRLDYFADSHCGANIFLAERSSFFQKDNTQSSQTQSPLITKETLYLPGSLGQLFARKRSKRPPVSLAARLKRIKKRRFWIYFFGIRTGP